MAQVERLLARKDSHLRVEDNRIVLSPLEADPPLATATALADRITERLPQVELSDLLIEVDSWTHFSDHFIHRGRRRHAAVHPVAPSLCQHSGPCL